MVNVLVIQLQILRKFYTAVYMQERQQISISTIFSKK